MPGLAEARRCLEAFSGACGAAAAEASRMREALGKGRGKGAGLARMLLGVVAALQEPLGLCLGGCLLPETPWDVARCGLAAGVEELVRRLGGLAARLEALPRLEGEEAERLARIAVDAAEAGVASVCAAAGEALRLIEALAAGEGRG